MCLSKWFCFCHARFIVYCDFFRTDFFRTKYIEYFRILKINLIQEEVGSKKKKEVNGER